MVSADELTVGDILIVGDKVGDPGRYTSFIKKGDLVQVIELDGSNCPHFEVLTGDNKGSCGWFYLDRMHMLVKKEREFKPMIIELDNIEDFELMKSIMHLNNKVSGSSFFDLNWTPSSTDVRLFMKRMFKQMDEMNPGWSKYQKD